MSEKTEGAISSLIERFDPDDRPALVNAIHFRGEWTRGFDPDRTAPAPFRLRSGATVDIPAMRIDGLSAGYRSDADFEAVSVPYGDGAFAFAAMLPRDGMAPEEALGWGGWRRTRPGWPGEATAMQAARSSCRVLRWTARPGCSPS